MYHEFPFSLGRSGHSLFNVYNKSILLCYWMIDQESRQRIPLNFHLLLVQPAVLISNVPELLNWTFFISPFMQENGLACLYWIFLHMAWKLSVCTPLVYIWSTQDSPTRRQFRTFSLMHKIYPRPPCQVFLCFCGRHSRENETEAPKTNECLSTMSLIKV